MPVNKRSWTDEQLATAVASSRSYRAVQRALGVGEGSSTAHVKRYIESRGLDTSHFRRPTPPLGPDDRLLEIAASCATATAALQQLGAPVTTYHFNKLKRRLRLLGFDISKFRRGPVAGRRRTSWSDDQLRRAVPASSCYAAVLRALGLIPAGGNYDQVKRRVRELGLDTSHFKAAFMFLKGGGARPRPLEELLVADRQL